MVREAVPVSRRAVDGKLRRVGCRQQGEDPEENSQQAPREQGLPERDAEHRYCPFSGFTSQIAKPTASVGSPSPDRRPISLACSGSVIGSLVAPFGYTS